MKAERRHELKQNELADWLGARMELIKPHVNGIVLGVIVLAVIIVGGTVYFNSETVDAAKAWTSYFEAFNAREPQKSLQELAATKSGSKAAWWALEAVADMNLGQGAALLHSDRSEAKKHLDKAAEIYKQVEAAEDPMLKGRARLGLAKTYESLCQPDDARKYYELVAETQKDTAIGKAAAEGARRMKDDREIAFLDWFAKQTPKKPVPLPGFGGGVPGLPSTLSDRPDIAPPSGLGLGNLGTGTPPEPAASFPAPGATTTPAEPSTTPEAPKTDAPAEKPAEAKPAETPPTTAPATSAPPEDGGAKKSD